MTREGALSFTCRLQHSEAMVDPRRSLAQSHRSAGAEGFRSLARITE
jgi:hypothetical protein